jgi:hypothetical protein
MHKYMAKDTYRALFFFVFIYIKTSGTNLVACLCLYMHTQQTILNRLELDLPNLVENLVLQTTSDTTTPNQTRTFNLA